VAGQVGGERFGDFSRLATGTVVVNDGVARDVIDPAFELREVAQAAEPSLDFHEHILSDVVRRGRVVHPRADELPEAVGKFVPDGFERWRHGVAGFTASMMAEAK
jgi:hypothetical protein